jgi:glycerophosphoryl diester phosphodiesterase
VVVGIVEDDRTREARPQRITREQRNERDRRDSRTPVLVSAHRCGAGADKELENGLEALDTSVEMGADYIEFDVQRLASGEFVVSHEVPHEGIETTSYASILEAIAARGAGAHIDFKFESPEYLYDDPSATYEVDATRIALEIMGGPERLCVTTNHVHSVRAIRDWADTVGLDEMLVGLSLGRPTHGLTWGERLAVRRAELMPERLMAESRANLVCVHHALATLNVARWARRNGYPMLVWTVDDGAHLRSWLRPGRAWMVTSNHPRLALTVRPH